MPGWRAPASEPALLRLVAHDNGEGFAPTVPHGIGLTAMRERVRSINGSTNIESSPDSGTTISISVPLPSLSGDVQGDAQTIRGVA